MDSGWEYLPWYILESILDKVETQQDYLQFGVVCESWHSITMTRKQKSQVNTIPQVPMLLVPSEQGNHSHALYDVVTKTFSKSKLFVPYDKRFASFSLGWLFAVEQDYSITLHKAYPNNNSKYKITSTIIHLPPLPDDNFINHIDYHIAKAVITADPLTSPEECIVAVIFGQFYEIAFIRPGKDTSWTRVRRRGLSTFDDILCYNGKFYVVDTCGKLFSIEVGDQSRVVVNFVARKIPYDIYGKTYIVESQGKLLLISRLMDWVASDDMKTNTRKTTKVSVYRLNVVKRKWMKVQSIGENALFLGDNMSTSISCLDFPECKSNCIYFTHDNDSLLSSRHPLLDFGEYDLQSKTMALHFGIDITTLSGRVPIWVVPYAR